MRVYSFFLMLIFVVLFVAAATVVGWGRTFSLFSTAGLAVIYGHEYLKCNKS